MPVKEQNAQNLEHLDDLEARLGVWMLQTALVIPENELWLHQPAISGALQRAFTWAQHNPTQESNLDVLLEHTKHGG